MLQDGVGGRAGAPMTPGRKPGPASSSWSAPPYPATRARTAAASRSFTERPVPMLTTPWAAEREAACTARATSRTSTKSRCTPSPASLSSPSPDCMALRIASARRPSGDPAGVPGPTGEKTRSTMASRPEPRTSSVPASLLTPYGPPGRGTASSAVEDPGWEGPYSEAQPSWTRRAPQPLRRRASQTVATATVLCRVSSRAPPRVAAGAVDHDPGVDGVQEAGQGSRATGGEVEPDVGVVAAPERGELDGRVGEQAVGDETAQISVGTEQ